MNAKVDITHSFHNPITQQPAHCQLRIFDVQPWPVVIFSELPDNEGISVTNASENLATEVVARYQVDPENTIWIEQYPADQMFGATDTYDRIRYRWHSGVASYPSWNRLDPAYVAELIGQQDETIVQALPLWKTERCSVCGGGFSAKSWDERHTDPRDGMSDCHASCCPRCKAT